VLVTLLGLTTSPWAFLQKSLMGTCDTPMFKLVNIGGENII
jgi:hypothetical protein